MPSAAPLHVRRSSSHKILSQIPWSHVLDQRLWAVHLVDDLRLDDANTYSGERIDWTSELPGTDVERARLVYRFIRETGRDVIHVPDGKTGWELYESGPWREVDEAEIRNVVHTVGDRIRDAAEATEANARALRYKADGTKPTDEDNAAADRREKEAQRAHSAARAFGHSALIEAIIKKELPALPTGTDARGRTTFVTRHITDFDQNPDVLGVRNGVVDLRTGQLRPYRRDDLISKVVDLDYDPDAEAPRWEKYLAEVFIAEDGSPDPEYVAFMRRLIGYGVTGRTREHILPVLFGQGSNGKSVFIETLTHVFGAHAQTTGFDTFTEKPSGGIPNDIAGLRGARLVMASEGSATRQMDEALVKRLTGGDSISARFMRKEFFTYKPAFLILLATNYKPQFRGQDEGLWRRVKLLPFRASFPAADKMPEEPSPFIRHRDEHLTDKLATEAAGILTWAVRGAVEWYESGLAVPASIRKETEDYRTESDSLGEFISDVLDVTGESKDSVFLTEMFPAYTAWAEDAGEKRPFGRKLFGQMLGERRGITKTTLNGKTVFRGVRRLTEHERMARDKAAERSLRAV